MTGGERAPAAPLRTIRLELVPLDPEADAGPLHRAYGDEAVMRWWTRPACADAGETRRYLTECAGLPGARLWTVRSSDGPGRGDVLGLAGLLGAVDVPGLTWLLRRDAWGHGYAREAARAVADHALGPLGLDRVEAWVEAANHRSRAVAAAAGLGERARLGQRYPHREHPHEVIVLGRAREEEPTAVLGTVVELPVRDVAGTLRLVTAALGARTTFAMGDPPYLAEVGLSPWSGGPRFRLAAMDPEEPPSPVLLHLDAATRLDALHRAAADAGAPVSGPPVLRPWGRREFVITLEEGHELTLSGPG
ncbi:GNAT family N-acetyltransferase [Streptomyces sp. NPDC046215]|uniref:N-acetyltransferase domain-containing protein n=1 Tax=Streptomyces stramineus TaxID=173861 RepID=A0ABN1B9W7_9ACTN